MKKICLITEIEDGQAKAFQLNEGETFLIARKGLAAYAYVNRCPHAGVEMQWQEDQFMSLDGTQIQCSFHGALFNVDDGYCTWGPCKGRSLTPVPIQLRDGIVYRIDSNEV